MKVFILAFIALTLPLGHAFAIERADIVGPWKLVKINFVGPKGPLPDPNFGKNPSGIIIYDASGWMNVQIATAGRPALVPSPRTARENTPTEARLKAVALDTYYGYFGRWEFDAAKSQMHHHIESSLMPYETGKELIRDARLENGRLSLIVHVPMPGGEAIRTLVWQRPHG